MHTPEKFQKISFKVLITEVQYVIQKSDTSLRATSYHFKLCKISQCFLFFSLSIYEFYLSCNIAWNEK